MYHAIGDDTAWCLGVAGEEPHGMSRVHHQGLVFLHHREVVHSQPELGPVGEHLAIASVCHQLLGKLRGKAGLMTTTSNRTDSGQITCVTGHISECPDIIHVYKYQPFDMGAYR